jgi:DNA-binding GntR family transcriptional regulator
LPAGPHCLLARHHSFFKVSPSTREQLLETFLRLAAVLELTTQAAQARGKADQHAALEACLAIFRARVEAGEAGSMLAESLARFGDDYRTFIEVELGWPGFQTTRGRIRIDRNPQ